MEMDPGRTIERYTVQSKLGQGGMAVVFRVRHNDLETEHALKILTLTNKGIRERLIQEGKVQAALRHPNIVSVTDVLNVGGAPGLLMEYVDGRSLEEWMEAYPHPDLYEAEAIFRGVVAGVGHAHGHGLIHRDLKPANVLLARDGDQLVPKVADFGLAKFIAEELETGAAKKRTRTGVSMGTPAYMAPEQIRDAKTADQRADVFSLGCILYELVCGGKQAFGAEDLYEIFQNIMSASYVDPGEVRDDLPPRIRNAIEGCLRPSRDRRISSCEELIAVLDGRLVPGAPASDGTFDPDALHEDVVGAPLFRVSGAESLVRFERKSFSNAALDAAVSRIGPSEPIPPTPLPDGAPGEGSTPTWQAVDGLRPGSQLGADGTVSQPTLAPPGLSLAGTSAAPLPAEAPARSGRLVLPAVALVSVAIVAGAYLAADRIGDAIQQMRAEGASEEATDGVASLEEPLQAVGASEAGSGSVSAGTARGTTTSGGTSRGSGPAFDITEVIVPIAGAPEITDEDAVRAGEVNVDPEPGKGEKKGGGPTVNVHMGGSASVSKGDGTAGNPDILLMPISSEHLTELPTDQLPAGWGAISVSGEFLTVWVDSAATGRLELPGSRYQLVAGEYRIYARFTDSDPPAGISAGTVVVNAGEGVFVRCDPLFNKCVKTATKQE